MTDKTLCKLLDNRCDDMKSKFTYRHLLNYLNRLDENELDQNVQIMPDHVTPDPVRLEPAIAVGTVKDWCHEDGYVEVETRNADDFKHHPEQIIILTDGSPFSEDGDTYYTMKDGIFIGDKSGKEIPWVKRFPCEPSIKTSRTDAFKSKMTESDDELDEMLAKLCELGFPSKEQLEKIEQIQAELYRRLHYLPEEDDDEIID